MLIHMKDRYSMVVIIIYGVLFTACFKSVLTVLEILTGIHKWCCEYSGTPI